MIKETLKELKKGDKIQVSHRHYCEKLFVEKVTGEHLIALDYVPNVLVKIPIEEIQELDILYKVQIGRTGKSV